MWALTLWKDPAPTLQWGVVIAACTVAAMTDLASRRIPNWLTGLLLLGGLFHAFLVGRGQDAWWMGIADGLVACVIMAFPYVFLFLFARGGAGDAKLMGAIGVWLGIVNGMATLVAVCLSGVVLALVIAAMRGRAREVVANVSGMAYGAVYSVASRGKVGDSLRPVAPNESMMTMPYGLAIFVGVCVSAAGVWLWRT